MSDPLLNRHITVRQGAYLPHWTTDGAIYHTVFRLADALPATVVSRYRLERDVLIAECGDTPTRSVQDRLNELYHEQIEHFLDSGRGACWLARPEIAVIVAAALRHFDGARYHLHAWCVMPNHVHAIVQPSARHGLSALLHSWKSYTATTANRLLGRSGEFWQKESYDHIIRDEIALKHSIRYVVENPLKANLPHYPWVWPKL